MRILVAEDDSRLLTQLDALLQQNGYSVDLADNGDHALFLIKEYDYDLAIVDIGMPKLDGFEVIRKARQADISCPILILTARDRWQEKVEGLDAGADDYLTKPASSQLIIQTLLGEDNMVVDNETVMSPDRLEWEHIQQVLKANHGNISQTARALNMHRRTLQRKLQKKPVYQ